MPIRYIDSASNPQSTSRFRYLDEAQEKKTVAGFVANIPKSAGNLVSNVATAVTHPVQTVKTVAQIPRGIGQKVRRELEERKEPGQQYDKMESEKVLDSIVDMYKDRYGSIEKAKDTAYNDPVGVASDLSTLLSGTGAIVSGAGKVGKSGQLAQAGKTLSKVGLATDPVAATTSKVGKVLESATEGRVVAPLKKSYDAAAVKTAEEIGVDLPPSAASKSKVVQATEALVGRGLFGSNVQTKVEKATKQLREVSNKVAADAQIPVDLRLTGKTIVGGIEKYTDSFRKVKNDLYSEVSSTAKVVPEKTVAFLDNVIADKKAASKVLGQDAPDLTYYQNLRKGLATKSLNANQVRSALKELNTKIGNRNDPIATGDRATLKRVAASLGEDFESSIAQTSPEYAEALAKANEFYSQGIKKINSTFGKRITQLKDNPEQIVSAIIKPNSESTIPTIYEVVGPEGKEAIQGAFVQSLMEKAKKKDGTLDIAALQRERKRFGDKTVEAILSPEQLDSLENLEEKLGKIDQVESALRRGQKVAEGSQTAYIARLASEVTLLVTNFPVGVQAIITDLLASKLYNSTTGQKLLTTGVELTGETGRKVQRAGQKSSPVFKLLNQIGRTQREGRDR